MISAGTARQGLKPDEGLVEVPLDSFASRGRGGGPKKAHEGDHVGAPWEWVHSRAGHYGVM